MVHFELNELMMDTVLGWFLGTYTFHKQSSKITETSGLPSCVKLRSLDVCKI